VLKFSPTFGVLSIILATDMLESHSRALKTASLFIGMFDKHVNYTYKNIPKGIGMENMQTKGSPYDGR